MEADTNKLCSHVCVNYRTDGFLNLIFLNSLKNSLKLKVMGRRLSPTRSIQTGFSRWTLTRTRFSFLCQMIQCSRLNRIWRIWIQSGMAGNTGRSGSRGDRTKSICTTNSSNEMYFLFLIFPCRYKYFWLQNSPSVELMLRYTKYKEREHKFHIMPNTTPVFQKSTRKRRLQVHF